MPRAEAMRANARLSGVQRQQPTPTNKAANMRVAAMGAGIALTMLGAAYAAVPLYDMFCRVTGFGGTTQRADVAPNAAAVLDRKITIRFDSNVAGGLGWRFKPVERTVDVKLGENRLAFYEATNTSSVPLTGTASFNVAPESAGYYFSKIECFCFTEQTLQPGESVQMPVSFFIDPEFAKDKDTLRLSQVTLSYTFFPVDKPQSETAKSDATRADARPPSTSATERKPKT